MLFIQNYQNQYILVETTACQSWLVFLRHSVVITDVSSSYLSDILSRER